MFFSSTLFILILDFYIVEVLVLKNIFYLLLFSLLLFQQLPVSAHKFKTFQPLKPIDNALCDIPENQSFQQVYPNDVNNSYPRITQVELALFNYAFENENIYSRLNRIEKRLFKKTFDSYSLSNRVDNILSNVDKGIIFGISNKELAKLETKVLGRTYPNDDTESRITRMEKEMLGAMQNGSLNERLDTIKQAAKHYNSFPEIVQSQFVNPQLYSGYNSPRYSSNKRGVLGFLQNVADGLLGSLGTMSSGYFTGFTPPLYDVYNPYSFGPGYGQQDFTQSRNGWSFYNRNTGSGSNVRILD